VNTNDETLFNDPGDGVLVQCWVCWS